MKILVIQLARLGDIFCTVPALSALRRTRPEAEIHFLVRKKFSGAAEVCRFYDHLWQWDAERLLGEFIRGNESIPEGLTRLSSVIRELRNEKFDQIINLSFSPSSSFITHLISQGQTPTLGYSRTDDFYLSVPDDPSLYFRAQAGIGKNNRVHVCDLLSAVAGADLIESDLHPLRRGGTGEKQKGSIVCHLGASQRHKTWPTLSWVRFLSSFINYSKAPIRLIGGSKEVALAQAIAEQVGSSQIINQVGKTTIPEIISILQEAELFIGADSGPLHAAGLVGVKSLNLSLGQVRFWETGSTVKGSRALVSTNPEHLMSETVLKNALEMLSNTSPSENVALCTGQAGVRYKVVGNIESRDCWAMVDWMYFGGPTPSLGGDIPAALVQLLEVVGIATQQLQVLEKNPEKTQVISILDRLDEILSIFRKSIPPLTPLLDEFICRKENIPPGPRGEVFYQTLQCYKELQARAQSLSQERRKEEAHL